MSDAPELIEYVLQPIESDTGEMPVMHAGDPFIIDVRLTDLADGLTMISVPEDVTDQMLRLLRDQIAKSPQAMASGQFFIVRGDTSKWRTVRLIRKDKWDADYREPA